jgi:hypothetical protein
VATAAAAGPCATAAGVAPVPVTGFVFMAVIGAAALSACGAPVAMGRPASVPCAGGPDTGPALL